MKPEEVLPALGVVLSDHRPDCATIHVACPGGDFTLQFTTGTALSYPVWNVSNPPRTAVESFEEVERGERYVLLRSSARSPNAAYAEATDLIDTIGGDDAVARFEGTEEIYKGVLPTVRSFVGQVRDLVDRARGERV